MRVFPETPDQGRKTHPVQGGSSPTAGVPNWIKRSELSTGISLPPVCGCRGQLPQAPVATARDTNVTTLSHHSGLCPQNISQRHSWKASSLSHFCGKFWLCDERVTNTSYYPVCHEHQSLCFQSLHFEWEANSKEETRDFKSKKSYNMKTCLQMIELHD